MKSFEIKDIVIGNETDGEKRKVIPVGLGYCLFRQGLLILVWFCLGLFLEIHGPAMKDLKAILNTNYADLSRAISGRSAGFLVVNYIFQF